MSIPEIAVVSKGSHSGVAKSFVYVSESSGARWSTSYRFSTPKGQWTILWTIPFGPDWHFSQPARFLAIKCTRRAGARCSRQKSRAARRQAKRSEEHTSELQ